MYLIRQYPRCLAQLWQELVLDVRKCSSTCCLVLACLLLSCLVLSCLVWSGLVLSCLVLVGRKACSRKGTCVMMISEVVLCSTLKEPGTTVLGVNLQHLGQIGYCTMMISQVTLCLSSNSKSAIFLGVNLQRLGTITSSANTLDAIVSVLPLNPA